MNNRAVIETMQHSRILLSLFLAIAWASSGCKDANQGFSPGPGDPRIVGTWRLYERRFPKDSTYSVRRDTITTFRDTSYYVTKRYPVTPSQTLTFLPDGSLSASGTEMTYYYPIRHFRVDSTFQDSLGVNLYINTNHANVPLRQRVAFLNDTLVLKQRCDQPCYLKLLRVRL
ncbi:MAG: hypothetical protein JWP57_305 [Spirosoma sp.]|nr:hypothetical protein [Spirosoma sp.]